MVKTGRKNVLPSTLTLNSISSGPRPYLVEREGDGIAAQRKGSVNLEVEVAEVVAVAGRGHVPHLAAVGADHGQCKVCQARLKGELK